MKQSSCFSFTIGYRNNDVFLLLLLPVAVSLPTPPPPLLEEPTLSHLKVTTAPPPPPLPRQEFKSSFLSKSDSITLYQPQSSCANWTNVLIHSMYCIICHVFSHALLRALFVFQFAECGVDGLTIDVTNQAHQAQPCRLMCSVRV